MQKIVLSALFLTALSLSAQPRVVATRFAASDLPVADAVFTPPTEDAAGSDWAPALQRAIDELATRGGGTLFLPAAEYPINSPVVVKEGVVLRGDNPRPAVAEFGTIFVIRHQQADKPSPPTFGLQRGSGLRELVFWYPEQSLDTPRPYPWTIATTPAQAGNNQSIINCTLVNPYRAIKIGNHFNELHTIRNVRICPLHTGIEMDGVTDIGRLDNVRIDLAVWADSGLPGTPAAVDKAGKAPLAALGVTGVDIGRSDWEYMYNLQIHGVGTGLRIRKGARGTTNAVMAYCDISDCDTALELNELNGVGLSAYNCDFSGRTRAVQGSERFTTVAQFHSCRFSSPALAIQLSGSGTLSCLRCEFLGGACQTDVGQLLLIQCDANGYQPQLNFGADVKRWRVLGGNLAQSSQVQNLATQADWILAPIPEALQTPPLPPLCPPGHDRHVSFPADTPLILVTDYGADCSLADNGPAFQRALDHAGSLGRPAVVYAPAGLYAFRSDLLIPSQVELRGSFAVPHHTVSAGTVLLIHHGQGDEAGQPFLSLQRQSGLRGLTCWYPQQRASTPVPYPWTIRSLGPQCWLVDVTIGNAWQAADLASHDATGMIIDYLAGAVFRRGLAIANADNAQIRDLQFNPHYSNRLHTSLPCAERPNRETILACVDFQRANLEGISIRDSSNLLLRGNFLYAAKDGIVFRGHCQADILMQGIDTAWHAAVLANDSAEASLRFALAQLVPLGSQNIAAIVSTSDFVGEAIFLNSQFWAGNGTAQLDGPGRVRLEQFNSLTGPVVVNNGHCHLSAALFNNSFIGKVVASGQQQSLAMLTPISSRGAFPYEVPAGSPLRAFAMSNQLLPKLPENADAFPIRFHSDCENAAQPPFTADLIATPGGGLRRVRDLTCRMVARDDAHSGRHAILLQGVADSPDYAYAYCQIYSGPIAVMPDTVFSYWIKPLTQRGLHSGVDLRFTNGMVLRDMGIKDSRGRGTHVSMPKGPLDQWTKVSVNLGQSNACGLVIDKIMLAYDSRLGSGDIAVLVDDIAITSTLPAACWQTKINPPSGNHPAGTAVSIDNPSGLPIHFTLDGSNPTAQSPIFHGPLTLPAGCSEFRCAFIISDNADNTEPAAPPAVMARFYNIIP
ncbi:MAG: hypothetical protein GX945_11030 [Lentisphaerae bacterium]|nr:hypothetical protein [Lentisphaerota bacterium]